MCAYNAQNGGPGGGAPWRVPRGGTRRPTSENEGGGAPLSNEPKNTIELGLGEKL